MRLRIRGLLTYSTGSTGYCRPPGPTTFGLCVKIDFPALHQVFHMVRGPHGPFKIVHWSAGKGDLTWRSFSKVGFKEKFSQILHWVRVPSIGFRFGWRKHLLFRSSWYSGFLSPESPGIFVSDPIIRQARPFNQRSLWNFRCLYFSLDFLRN